VAVHFPQGGEKLQEAFYIFQELGEKYGATPLLLNGQAAALIQQGKYEDADGPLQRALEKDPNSPETLINCIAVAQGTGKPQEVHTRSPALAQGVSCSAELVMCLPALRPG